METGMAGVKQILKRKEGASSLNEYSYLSPKGKYGYFIFHLKNIMVFTQ